jgi:hypothetical protein
LAKPVAYVGHVEKNVAGYMCDLAFGERFGTAFLAMISEEMGLANTFCGTQQRILYGQQHVCVFSQFAVEFL